MRVRYLSTSPIYRDPRLRIRGIGIAETMPATYVQRPTGTRDFFFLTFHDAAWIGPPASRRAVDAGTMVVWRPGEGHFYGNPQQPWSHSWIHCDGPAVVQAVRSAGLRTGSPVLLADASRVTKYLFDLHEELAVHAQPDGVILANCLESWLREIRRDVRGPRTPRAPAELLGLKRRLERSYAQPLRLDALAQSVGLSVPHFCSQFKRYFGVPAMTYVTQVRLREAVRLLRHTELGVGAIAAHVGYGDIYHFSKIFKRHIGVSPSRVRRSA